jgi:hypothetical protein
MWHRNDRYPEGMVGPVVLVVLADFLILSVYFGLFIGIF